MLGICFYGPGAGASKYSKMQHVNNLAFYLHCLTASQGSLEAANAGKHGICWYAESKPVAKLIIG